MNLYDSIETLKGVGPKTKNLLNNCSIFTVLDLLLYFPRDYEKIHVNLDGQSMKGNSLVVLKCNVIGIDRDIRTKNRRVISSVVFKSGDSIIRAKWFNQPYMKEKFKNSGDYILTGKISEFRGEKVLINPSILREGALEPINPTVNNEKEGNAQQLKLTPKYSLRNGITNIFLIKMISQILSSIRVVENLPGWIIKKYNLVSLDNAIRNIHNPQSYESLISARKRLKFQELFTYSLKILMLKDYINKSLDGIAFKIAPELTPLKENLPFQLTNAQSKVVREVLLDQKKKKQMNRLIQGDVGSGKTIVAIISMFNVVMNGYQAVMMAPTEILASQHFEEIKKVLNSFNLNVELLRGNMPSKEKIGIKQDLKEGKIDIIVGTHALLEDDVEFKNLGLVVTDEQHRFGVMQRSTLFNKGKNVDILVMTATPIPRTLALYLYGDLDVSIIDELPPGRQRIETFYIDENKKAKVYEFALKEIANGRQIYVVCPLVEENEELSINSVEKLYNELSQLYFRDINVGILHGKMQNKLKEDVMSKFKNSEIKVLISTTVIEVGINVPNATVMIIENAERFGLAQLHQLRGRVGRGSFKSYCILVANIKNETVKRRLQIIQENSDGFKIAEEDLKIRGSGELFGFRQHGESNLILSDLIDDLELLKIANAEAKKLIVSNSKEDIDVKNYIFNQFQRTSKFICFN